MLDKELVARCQSGDKKSFEIIYERYKPLIYKHWIRLKKGIPNLNQEDQEDFLSSSYLEMVQAIKKVDLSKIYDDNWKFLGYFGYYLSNLRKKFAKTFLRNEHVKKVYWPKVQRSPEEDFLINVNMATLQSIATEKEKRIIQGILEGKKINQLTDTYYEYKKIMKKLKERLI